MQKKLLFKAWLATLYYVISCRLKIGTMETFCWIARAMSSMWILDFSFPTRLAI